MSDPKIKLIFKDEVVILRKSLFSKFSTIGAMMKCFPDSNEFFLKNTPVSPHVIIIISEGKKLKNYTNKELVNSISSCDFLGGEIEYFLKEFRKRLTNRKFPDDEVLPFNLLVLDKIFSIFLKSSFYLEKMFPNFENSKLFEQLLPHMKVLFEKKSDIKKFKGAKCMYIDEKIEIDDEIQEHISETEFLCILNKNFSHLTHVENTSKLCLMSPNFADFSNLIHLTHLEIRNTKVTDISLLVNLDYLDMSMTKIVDLSSQKNLTNLKARKTDINALKTISFPEKLKYLDISSCGLQKISDMRTSGNFFSLKSLNIGLNPLSSIEGISMFSELKKLTAYGSLISADLTEIGRLTDLKKLCISFKNQNISFLENLEKLEKLNITENPLKVRHAGNWSRLGYDNVYGDNDFLFLKKLNKLETLTIRSVKFNNISHISGDNLTSLNVSNSPVDSLKGIGKMKKLTNFYGRRTKISDISDLKELEHVKYINIDHNKDISDVSMLSNVRILHVGRTKVRNFSELTKLREIFIESDLDEILQISENIKISKKFYCRLGLM
jgi:hypothetical protein